jgi:hypothetical protein
MPLLTQWPGHTALLCRRAVGTTIRKTVIMQAANATGKIRLGIEHLMQIVESFGHIPVSAGWIPPKDYSLSNREHAGLAGSRSMPQPL